MIGLAARSLARRRAAFVSTFLGVLLATALTTSFACLGASATPDGLSDGDAETLAIMGLVVGGWGTVIALFALTSSIGVTVRQRAAEVGLLRTIGATPRQVRRMVLVETLLVATIAAALGTLAGWAGGATLLTLLRDQGVVAADVGLAGEALVLGPVGAAVVLVALVAAVVAGRRSVRGPARAVVAEAHAGTGRMRWWRVLLGLLLLAHGTTMGAITVPVARASDDPYAPMQTAGSAAIVAGVGLAVLSPVLLRWSAVALRPLLALAGAPGELAALNATRRAGMLAGVLGPVVVFVATTVSVVLMVGVDGRRLMALVPDAQEAETITLLNYVVTGMIALFAAIMVVTAVVAVTADRRSELERLRLVGASRAQVRRSVRVEAVLLTVTGTALGLLASCVTVVPYSVARDEGVVPDGLLWWPVVVALAAAVLTIGASALALRRTLPAPVAA